MKVYECGRSLLAGRLRLFCRNLLQAQSQILAHSGPRPNSRQDAAVNGETRVPGRQKMFVVVAKTMKYAGGQPGPFAGRPTPNPLP